QRGTRVASRTETVVTKERKLAVDRILLTGGLMLTKEVEKSVISTSQKREPFALLQRRDGGPEVILYEQRLNFRFLGTAMQPSSRANFDLTVGRLRAAAPGAPLDERAGQ